MTGHFPAVHAHCPIGSADMRKPARRRIHRHRVRHGLGKAGLGPSVAPAGAIPRCFGAWRACTSTQPRLFLSRQRKKRRGIRISRRPYPARLPDFPCQGKPGENPSRTPQGRSRCRRNERESAMPELAATHAAGAEPPSQSCLEKHQFGLSSALASALENRGQPTFSE